MNNFSYSMIPEEGRKPTVGLIVLQSDETVESELHKWLPPDEFELFVSRVPSGEKVTEETLGAMAGHIAQAASLFPSSAQFDAVAYCCTSGTSVIGAEKVAELVRTGCNARAVTHPLTALVDICERRNLKRLAFLSPYIESVSSHLREAIAFEGIETPVFGSFNEGEEAKVAWIDDQSIRHAACALASDKRVDGIFLSCTNLKTYALLEQIEAACGVPVLSSNFVLAEHLRRLGTAKPV